jgi:hypothetical protein
MLNFPRALSHAFFYALSKGGFEFFEGKKTECKIQRNVLTAIQNGFDYYYLCLVETVNFANVVVTDNRVDLKGSVYNVSFQLMDSTMTSTLFKYDLLNLGYYAFNIKLIKDTRELTVDYFYDDYTPQTITPYVLSLKNDIFYYYKNQVDSKWYGDLPDEFISLLNEDYGTFNLDDSLLYLFTPSIFAFDIIPSSHGYDAAVEAVGFSGSGVKVNDYRIDIPKPPRPTPTPPIPPSPPIPPTPPPRPPDPTPPTPPTPPVYPPTPTGLTYLFTGTVENPIDVLPDEDYVLMYFNQDCYRVDSKPYKIDALLTDHYFVNVTGQTGTEISEYYYNVETSMLYHLFNVFILNYDRIVNDRKGNSDGDWELTTTIDFLSFKIGFTKSTQQNTDGDTTITLKITEVSISDTAHNIYFVGIKNAEDIFTVDPTSYSYEHKTAVTSNFIDGIAFPHITFPTTVKTEITKYPDAATNSSFFVLLYTIFCYIPTPSEIYGQVRGLLSNIYVDNTPLPPPPSPVPATPDYPYLPVNCFFCFKGDLEMPIKFTSNLLNYDPLSYHIDTTAITPLSFMQKFVSDHFTGVPYIGIETYFYNVQLSPIRMLTNTILMNYLEIASEGSSLNGNYSVKFTEDLDITAGDQLIYTFSFTLAVTTQKTTISALNISLDINYTANATVDNICKFSDTAVIEITPHSCSYTPVSATATALSAAKVYTLKAILNPFPTNFSIVYAVPSGASGSTVFVPKFKDCFDAKTYSDVYERLYKPIISCLYSRMTEPDYPPIPDNSVYMSQGTYAAPIQLPRTPLLYDGVMYHVSDTPLSIKDYMSALRNDTIEGIPNNAISLYFMNVQVSPLRVVINNILENFDALIADPHMVDAQSMPVTVVAATQMFSLLADTIMTPTFHLSFSLTVDVPSKIFRINDFYFDFMLMGVSPNPTTPFSYTLASYDLTDTAGSTLTVDATGAHVNVSSVVKVSTLDTGVSCRISDSYDYIAFPQSSYLPVIVTATGTFDTDSIFMQRLRATWQFSDDSDSFKHFYKGLVSCLSANKGTSPEPPKDPPTYPDIPDPKNLYLFNTDLSEAQKKQKEIENKKQKEKEKTNG